MTRNVCKMLSLTCFILLTCQKILSAGIEIQKFYDETTHHSKFVEYVSSLNFTATKIDSEMAKVMAKKLNHRLREYIEPLEQFKEEIQNSYDDVIPLGPEHLKCCEVQGKVYSSILRRSVDYDDWCFHGGNVSLFLPQKKIVKVAKAKYNVMPGIKYLYIGEATGVLYNYPAIEFCGENYDPRLRPWYQQLASVAAKDVVVIIDNSNYIKDSQLEIAKKAATTVLRTLKLNDRIAVVVTAGLGITEEPSCYNRTLARKSDINKKNLIEYIDDLLVNQRNTNTSYFNAFRKAFDLFHTEDPYDPEWGAIDKVVLFFSNGRSSENMTLLYKLLKEEQQKYQNKIHIFTFGLNPPNVQPEPNRVVLRNIAKQTSTTTNPTYLLLNSLQDMQTALFPYYNFFKSGHNKIGYVLYNDLGGSGTSIALCQTIFHRSTFKGVACLDVDPIYILDEVLGFQDYDGSYAFIVDDKSRIVTHPFLPSTANSTTETISVFLSAVEYYNDSLKDMTLSMIQGIAGEKSATVKRAIRRGTGQGAEIFKVQYDVTFYWHPITDSQPILTLCIVAKTGAKQYQPSWEKELPSVEVVYDSGLISADKKCDHFGRKALRNRSSIILSPKCFTNSSHYIHSNQWSIDDITDFLTNRDSQVAGIKSGVREIVAMSASLDQEWSKMNEQDTLWKQFTSINGVQRIFPGTGLQKEYDATTQPDFIGAMANKDVIFITPPHADPAGTGPIITLSKAVVSSKDRNRLTLGAVSIAMKLETFYYKFIGENFWSNNTFVLNNAGYIIMKREWIGKNFSREVHLAEVEPDIAAKMIKIGIMRNSFCINISGNFEKIIYWTIDTNGTKREDEFFSISPIPNTNCFIVIAKRRNPNPECEKCSPWKKECNPVMSCQCPCKQSDFKGFEKCSSTFEADEFLPCGPKIKEAHVRPRDSQVIGSNCFRYNCEDVETGSGECPTVCSYCNRTAGRHPNVCNKPFCSNISHCPNGMLFHTYTGCSGTPKPPKAPIPHYGLQHWLVAVIATLTFIFGLGLAVFIMCCICLHYRLLNEKIQPDSEYQKTEYDTVGFVREMNHVYLTQQQDICNSVANADASIEQSSIAQCSSIYI